MGRKIAYIGFGALGNQIAQLIYQSAKDQLQEVYFDDTLHNGGHPHAVPFDSYKEEQYKDYEFFICLGYKHLDLKTSILHDLNKLQRDLATFVHPSCIINPTAKIEAGCLLYQGCNIDQGVTIKSGSLLNNGVVVSHDSIIHDNCFLAPGVVVCGNVSILHQSFIGAGTVISNNITIGSNVIIGPGTVVTHNVSDGASAIGSPMRILDKRLTLL